MTSMEDFIVGAKSVQASLAYAAPELEVTHFERLAEYVPIVCAWNDDAGVALATVMLHRSREGLSHLIKQVEDERSKNSKRAPAMNAASIECAARKIRDLELALLWLREHGRDAIMPEVKDTFGVHVSLNSCSALPGAKEAAAALSAQARLMGRELVASAIKDAENTIEILREKIAREVSR